MKTKIVALAILAVSAVASVQAQETVKPTQDPAVQKERATQAAMLQAEQQTELKTKELGLTTEQNRAVKELDKYYYGTLSELDASVNDPEALAVKKAELKEQYDNRMRHLLTPEQFERMKAMR